MTEKTIGRERPAPRSGAYDSRCKTGRCKGQPLPSAGGYCCHCYAQRRQEATTP